MLDVSTPRPFTVTIMIWGVFIGGFINLWRAWAIMEQADLFQTFGFSFPLLVNLVVASFAVVALFGLGGMAWQGRAMVRVLMPAFLLTYATYHLGSKWVWGIKMPAWQMWTVLYSGGILFVLWTCWQPRNKNYWQKK